MRRLALALEQQDRDRHDTVVQLLQQRQGVGVWEIQVEDDQVELVNWSRQRLGSASGARDRCAVVLQPRRELPRELVGVCDQKDLAGGGLRGRYQVDQPW